MNKMAAHLIKSMKEGEAEGQRKCSERSTIVPIYTISQSIIIKDWWDGNAHYHHHHQPINCLFTPTQCMKIAFHCYSIFLYLYLRHGIFLYKWTARSMRDKRDWEGGIKTLTPLSGLPFPSAAVIPQMRFISTRPPVSAMQNTESNQLVCSLYTLKNKFPGTPNTL